MWLHRVTPDPFQADRISESNTGQEADSLELRDGVLTAKFDRFGNGSRRSDFEVGIGWHDVEEAISRFAQAAHPNAIELQTAVTLAKAVMTTGWKPPSSEP